MTDTNQFTIAEKDLLQRLGVPRALLRTARAEGLDGRTWARDVDWSGGGAGVFWTAKAAAEIAAAVGIQTSATPQPTVDVVEILTVASQPLRRCVGAGGLVHVYHFENPRVIKGRRDNGDEVFVRVPDSSKFTTKLRSGEPMTFRARLCGESWTLDQRAPRWPGRW